jgi:hypothetical protein
VGGGAETVFDAWDLVGAVFGCEISQQVFKNRPVPGPPQLQHGILLEPNLNPLLNNLKRPPLVLPNQVHAALDSLLKDISRVRVEGGHSPGQVSLDPGWHHGQAFKDHPEDYHLWGLILFRLVDQLDWVEY